MTKGTEVLLLGKLHEKVLPEEGVTTEVVAVLWCFAVLQRVSKLP